MQEPGTSRGLWQTCGPGDVGGKSPVTSCQHPGGGTEQGEGLLERGLGEQAWG